MGRKEDLDQHICESYALIREYEEVLRLSSDPKEKSRARREIEEQRELIGSWLEEYRQISGVLPNYIAEIADFPLLRAVNEIGGWMNSQGYAFEALEISEGPRFIEVDARLFQELRWDNWEPAQNLAQLVLSADRATQQAFIAYTARRLQSEDEEVRWTTGMLVETLVVGNPASSPSNSWKD